MRTLAVALALLGLGLLGLLYTRDERIDRLASAVEQLVHTVESLLQKAGPFMPAITWQSGGSAHTFPAMSPTSGETNDHFRARYIAALDADLKSHPVDQ